MKSDDLTSLDWLKSSRSDADCECVEVAVVTG